jgi:hypothetical protein
MTDTIPDPSPLARIQALQKKREQILALPPEEALERILADREPAALVHSFPEADFYFLVHDIGPEDALPLLALASDKQWDHIVDLESWARDRIEVRSVTRWLSLLLAADPPRFIRWFLKERLSFVEFYLFHNIEVRVREHDQDPSEFGDDFFTLDQVYYIRFLKLPAFLESSAIGEEQRREFLLRFIERLAAHDHLVFQQVLLESTHVIPAETEEEEFRWRSVRLAEKGFVPFDEALGVYQPVEPQELAAQTPKSIPPTPAAAARLLPVPAYPLRELKTENPFGRALARIEAPGLSTHLQWEFANLCNQVIVADQKTIRERDELRRIVAKVCGYISIGLQRLQDRPGEGGDANRAATALTRYPLIQLFRLGFGAAIKLKWQVERWLGTCWFASSGLRLTFWGEQWMGVLGGILLKKPLFYDNYKTGVLYREFESLADIAATEETLRRVRAVDDLLAALNVSLKPPAEYGFLTWKNLLLTRWCAWRLGLQQKTLEPVPLKKFIGFFNALLPGDPPAENAAPRRIPEDMKAAFVQWISAEAGFKDYEISETLGPIFTELFAEIESECSRVAAKDLDPRFVQLFLLKAGEPLS